MSERTAHRILAALMAVVGLYGIQQQVEYSGFLIFTGLLAFICA